MAEVKNGALVALGPTQVTDNSPTGAVTTDSSAAQPTAPANGIPSALTRVSARPPATCAGGRRAAVGLRSQGSPW